MFTFPYFSPKTRDTFLSSCFLKRSLSASMPWGYATKLLMRNSITPSIEQHRTQVCWLHSTPVLKRDNVLPRISPVRSVFSRPLPRVLQPSGRTWVSRSRRFPSARQVHSAFCPGVARLHLLCYCV